MDWQNEINKFKYLQAEALGMFAQPGEMHQAIAAYNKAIDRLKMDSADIALITLKKLAATYPMFAQASFLLGCCQMTEGHTEEAIEHLEHAILLDLPEEEHNRAQSCLNSARNEFEAAKKAIEQEQKSKTRDKNLIKSKQKNSDDLNSSLLPNQLGGASILHKSGRGGRVRMASDKEKREAVRKSEFPEEKQTHIVYNKNLYDYIRKALPVVVILIIAGILILGGVVLSDLIRNKNDNNIPDEKQRLEWLEDKLSGLAADDEKIVALLQQYNEFVNPEISEQTDESAKPVETSSDETLSTTEKPPAATPTPVPTTLSPVVIAKAALTEQFDLFEQVKAVQSENPVYAAEQILLIQEKLSEIPAETSIEVEVPEPQENGNTYKSINAADLLEEVISTMNTVGQKAADELRITARVLFDQKNYGAALVDYEKAFSFYPMSYGGGVAYYCGRCHQELNQYEQARPYYEFVIENFAGRELAGFAASRLSMMGY